MEPLDDFQNIATSTKPSSSRNVRIYPHFWPKMPHFGLFSLGVSECMFQFADVLHVSGVRKFIQTNFWIEFNQHSASCDSFRVP